MNERPVVVIGTANRGKSQEIALVLEKAGLMWKTLTEFSEVPPVEEDGRTFAENARKKASLLAGALKHWVLAEDSGLEVEALGGQPGVLSARFAGMHAADQDNYKLLLEKLRGVPLENRHARFVCHMAVADPEGRVRLEVCEVCHGRITEEPRGQCGFGYDPVFEIPEYHRTFAELGPVVKNAISHRGRALRKLVPLLVRLLEG